MTNWKINHKMNTLQMLPTSSIDGVIKGRKWIKIKPQYVLQTKKNNIKG